MAEKHVANAEAQWQAVCIVPDFCKVGAKPVPFDSFRDLAPHLTASPNVNARGTPVYPLTGVAKGTLSNAGKGIVSQSSKQPGNVVMLADSTTVNVNGLPSARHDTIVQMNVSPLGPNTIGKLKTAQGSPLGTSADKKIPCNDPPKSSPKLEELQKLKEQLKGMDPSQLDEYIRFGDANKALDSGIANIDIKNDGSWSGAAGNYAAQGTRAVLGFAKDIVMGAGQLAYSGAKLMTPGGQIHAGLDMAMLMEHIRLGNVCLQTLKDAAKKAGHELAKPVTDAWDKGNYVEAVTRGGLEIGSLLLIVGDLAKLAQVGKVAEVAKVSEVAKAAEVTKAAEAVTISERVTAAGKTVKEFGTTAWDGVKIKARSMRDLFLGRTPGKGSRTGREVIERMEKEGKIVRDPVSGEPTHFMDSKGNWRPMADGDMAHQTDAVRWWNDTGREFGARSPEVRSWMLDSKNYTVDYYGYNRSAGASLPDVYLPPLKR